jgi:hypothetical protein
MAKEDKKQKHLIDNLIKKGLDSIIKKKQKEYPIFKLIQKTKDFLKINPSTSDGWFEKGLQLKVNHKFHDDIYCFERSILLNSHSVFSWYELADSSYVLFDKDSKIYYEIARAINPNIKKMRDEMLEGSNPKYFLENKKIHKAINISRVNKAKERKNGRR